MGCEETGQAALIDPVISTMDRDLAEIARLGLKLAYTLDTHIHADHITAALELKNKVGSHTASPAIDNLPCTDLGIEEGVPLEIGTLRLEPIHTPGHTDGHVAYLLGDRLFTGVALLIDGCGRPDLQYGSADDLFHSVREKLFTLPNDTLVYPAHDYQDRRGSTIAQEKQRNPRLGEAIPIAQFKEIMASLSLPYPKFIDHAVPGNSQCGVRPHDLADNLRGYCDQVEHSPQG